MKLNDCVPCLLPHQGLSATQRSHTGTCWACLTTLKEYKCHFTASCRIYFLIGGLFWRYLHDMQVIETV
ncbi:hypothetical protein Plhal304r1_c009g0037731 [Plasmopara halstedii]